jgi:hypothetical protein
MRVVIPLFNFQYYDAQDFAFSDGRLSIRHFDSWGVMPERDIFSTQDRAYIGYENKALVAEAVNLEGYKLDSSLVLIAFRFLAEDNRITPIVKYRLSEDESLCSRIEDAEMHIRLPGYLYQFIRRILLRRSTDCSCC